MHGAISPLPQYAVMAWCLVKHKDNFSFTFKIYGYWFIVIILKITDAFKGK
jgi:hypothetical protein